MNNKRNLYCSDTRYEKIYEQMQLLGIQDVSTERQIKNWLTPKYKKLILDSQALKRQLKPDDVARLVLFLSSDQSSGCTKQSFIIDAGIT